MTIPLGQRISHGVMYLLALLALLFVASVPVKAQTLSKFAFNDFVSGSAKVAGVPFQVTIYAQDQNGNLLPSFNGQVTLVDSTATNYPGQTASFISGTWTGFVYITQSITTDLITASYMTVTSSSNTFTVVPDNRIKFINLYSGNNQSGEVGSLLPTSLTVKVSDPYGNVLPNIGVNFAVTSVPAGATNYSLGNSGGTSNASGLVSTTLTLGRKAGSYVVSANIASGTSSTTQFYLTATPSNLISIAVTPQVAVLPAGSYMPFKVVGYDQYLNDIALSNTTWTVQNGGGTIDSTGVFYAGNTLGSFSNTIKVTSGGIGATASVNIVDVWGGTAGAGGSGNGAGAGGGSGSGNGTTTASESATPNPTPTPAPTAGVLYNVQVEPEVLSILKNARIPIVAEGVDFYGNPVSGVNFDFQVSGSVGSVTSTGPNSVLLTASDNGVGTVTVTATQGKVAKFAKIVGSVGTGLNRRLVIEDIQSPQQVGEPFTISIAAKDSFNNFVTDYKGPLVLADTTGTIDPATVSPSDSGIWYVQAIISAANPEVTITAAGDGMIGVSNTFEVQGSPKKSDLGFGKGGQGQGIGGGLGDVLGASISGKINEILAAKNLNKYAVVRYIGAGLATGFGILGASFGGGWMASKGLEAIGRNPFAKGKLQLNLYISLIAFIIVASLAVFAAMMIVK